MYVVYLYDDYQEELKKGTSSMFLLNRSYLYKFDWISFFATFFLGLTGLFFVMSSTYMPEDPYSIFFKKQAFGLIAGFIIYLTFCFLDYRTLMRYGYFAYFGVLLLLIFTIIKGSIGMGAQRWINLGFIKLQPSELSKLFLPAFISYYFYTHHDKHKTIGDFMPIICILLCTFTLVLKQPDLGTAIIIVVSGAILLMHAEFPKRWFIGIMLLGVISAPLSWRILKPYQKKRIMVFLGHGDAHKERYQIEQSKIAIGSGGYFGKGYCKGTQNIFQFLPESRTDFIFAVIAEEWGFFGALFILLLFLTLVLRLLYITNIIIDPNIQLLALGLSMHIILSIFINIFMVIDLLPIVGSPLPLMSYGLSNLWVVLASLGWVNGIAMRQG